MCIGFSFFVGDIAPTVVEPINKIGSLANGPIPAVFALSLFVRSTGERTAWIGFATGLSLNLTLWLQMPEVVECRGLPRRNPSGFTRGNGRTFPPERGIRLAARQLHSTAGPAILAIFATFWMVTEWLAQ